MAGYEETRLVLLIRVDDDRRPVGTVQPEGGTPVAFTGWLSLMAAISQSLSGAAAVPDLAPGVPGEPALDRPGRQGAAPVA